MKIATPANVNRGFYYKKVRGVAWRRKRNFAAMGPTEKSLGTTVQCYNERNGLTFNCESRPKQKSLGDGGGSGATSCGENRREPSSSAPEAPHGH